jgi:hypothetical protein
MLRTVAACSAHAARSLTGGFQQSAAEFAPVLIAIPRFRHCTRTVVRRN